MSYNENSECMLVLTYHKQKPKHVETVDARFDYSTKRQAIEIQQRINHNREQGQSYSECGEKETLHKHRLMRECASSQVPTVMETSLPTTQPCKKYQMFKKKKNTDTQNMRPHTHTHPPTLRCDGLGLMQTYLNLSKPTFGSIQFRLFAFMMAGFLLTYVAQ